MRIVCILSIIVLTFSLPSFANTRFYLPSTGAPEVTPSPSANWNYQVHDYIRCVRNKVYSAMADKQMNIDNPGTNSYILNRIYVSDPIAPQVISGWVSGEVRGQQDAAQCNAYSAVLIKVVSNDGSVVRGTLLSLTLGAQEYGNNSTAYQAKTTPPLSNLSTVTAEAGDRIVIEIGIRRDSQNNRYVRQRFGDNSQNDLTYADGTETNDYNPWIEFSQDIIFPDATMVE